MTTSSDIIIPFEGANVPRFARLLLGRLRHIRYGVLTIRTPDAETIVFRGPEPGPNAHITFNDWRAVTLAARSGDIGLAEAYRDGLVEFDNLTQFLLLFARNAQALEAIVYGHWWGRLAYWLLHRARPNTRAGSKKNIHAHYDLGNDFYRLWLDPSMTYSSALFDGDLSLSLESAQERKYERILAQLDPARGSTILELGCGWGGFAEYAARTRRVHVRGITVSRAQLEFAKARIKAAGLDHLVELSFTDYRDVTGQFDHVVSIEMFEAVGETYWPAFFSVLSERMKPGGRAVIQTITIDEAVFDTYHSTSDFIRQYIFPGGMLPSRERFSRHAQAASLEVGETHCFGPDYAETLRRWRDLFYAARTDVEALGFDQAFERLWRFYYGYCEAGFESGRIDVMQVTLAKPR